MKNRLLVLAGLLSSIAVAACAGDANKRADDARMAELKDQREHQEKSAERRADQREDAAEARTDAYAASATGSEATKNRLDADAKMKEARDVYRAKATERLDKADARVVELKGRVDRAGAKTPTSARDSLQTVATQRSLVQKQIAQLPQVPNDGFEEAKSNINGQLDTLDALVEKAANDVEKIKK